MFSAWRPEGPEREREGRHPASSVATGHRVIICVAIKETPHPSHADRLDTRNYAAQTFDPGEDGVDCRVPGGVCSRSGTPM